MVAHSLIFDPRLAVEETDLAVAASRSRAALVIEARCVGLGSGLLQIFPLIGLCDGAAESLTLMGGSIRTYQTR